MSNIIYINDHQILLVEIYSNCIHIIFKLCIILLKYETSMVPFVRNTSSDKVVFKNAIEWSVIL